MTLGGLALAVGILVDDATVAIENTHRLMTRRGQPFRVASLEGAAGIAKPDARLDARDLRVFISVIFLDRPAKYLFTPQALAVVFAMLASYVLSRTLTPITDRRVDLASRITGGAAACAGSRRIQPFGFQTGFEDLRAAPSNTKSSFTPFFITAGAVVRDAPCPRRRRDVVFVGQDFFPQYRRGQCSFTSRRGRLEDRGDGKTVPAGRRHDPRGRPAQETSASSSTISACRPATTTSPSAMGRRSPPTTGRSSSRSSKGTRRPPPM